MQSYPGTLYRWRQLSCFGWLSKNRLRTSREECVRIKSNFSHRSPCLFHANNVKVVKTYFPFFLIGGATALTAGRFSDSISANRGVSQLEEIPAPGKMVLQRREDSVAFAQHQP